MNNKIKISLVANAGVLIEYNDYKYIIDGVHDRKVMLYSTTTKETQYKIISDVKPYNNLNYCLVTHNHPDHCSLEFIKKLDSLRNFDAMLLPNIENSNTVKNKNISSNLKDYFENQKNRLHLLDSGLYEKNSYLLPCGDVKYFKSNHLGYPDVICDNYCFILNINGKTILHLGDGEFDFEYLHEMLKDEPSIDLALLNYPAFASSKNIKMINAVINPKQIAVIHLPFIEDDSHGLCDLTNRRVDRYKNNLPETTILNKCEDHIFI